MKEMFGQGLANIITIDQPHDLNDLIIHSVIDSSENRRRFAGSLCGYDRRRDIRKGLSATSSKRLCIAS